MRCRGPALLAVLVIAACGDKERGERDPEPRPASATAPPREPRVDRALLVMVNTPDAVYRVDPTTLDVTELGRFSFPGGATDRITDLAMDRGGRMWAIGFEAVYAVDPQTYACTELAHHAGRGLNALAIMTPAVISQREIPDIMIAADAEAQAVFRVDPKTGALAEIGDLGPGLASSGDLTWAPGVGAVMITTDRYQYEGLARLEPDTFEAVKIGPGWGLQQMRGLTMLPDGSLLGVTEHGDMYAVDARTGAETLRRHQPLMFYGAAIGWETK